MFELGESTGWGLNKLDSSGSCVADEIGQPDGSGQFVWEVGPQISVELVYARDVIEMR